MRIYATRGSVAAGDDADAPHARHFDFPEGTSLEDALAQIQAARYLPGIAGGQASWSAASHRPVAVLAQQWDRPRLLVPWPAGSQALDWQNGTLRLHFNYHAQVEPETIYRVFWGYQLKAG